ncbi:MAG: alpha-2-macroglobulin family protein [Parvibaculum sp.]|uniref:alpha-2-macroglobulin family protein n=1 Tax=Parvibaculum sp. TaxID=2024848 RepID=UPI00283CE070|nr:alpha-2-macroglobulin family protein [Parvibaculum sp.]MDR3499749.1 alpha-2-macroglobulin family protein [Parvibaculum sp.]
MKALLRLLLLATLLPATAALADEAAPGGDLTVARITPSGEDVPAERQIVVEFNRPVVPLGRMERSAAEIPIEIAPKVDCEWRWLSPTALACQLKEADALKASTRYSMTINPGIKAEDGKTLHQAFHHEFITARVALDRAEFSGWNGPGEPQILVTFNQPVRRDSVVNRLAFVWKDGGGGEMAVHAAEGPDWSKAPDDALVDVPREPGLKGFFKRLLAYLPWFRPESVPATQEWARHTWLVTAKKPLPLDTDVELDMRPGLISGLGSEPSVIDQQAQKFATFGDFHFAGFRCTTNGGEELTIRPGEPVPADKACGPWNTVRLLFTSPVKLKELRDHVQLSPELGKAGPDDDPWANVDLDQTEGYYNWKVHQKTDEFSARYPVYLRSARDYQASLKPDDKTKIVDMFGRPLADNIDIRWRMDDRPPNFELPNNIAVLEKAIDSDVPLYVNNLTDRDFRYSRLTVKGIEDGLNVHQKLDPIRNLQYAVPFGVRDLLGNKSGAVLGTMSVKPALPSEKSGLLFAQVTPFGVHVKLAHYNTLVRVSDLATAAPVEGAKVVRYRDPVLMTALCESTVPAEWTKPEANEAEVFTDKDGLAILPGIAPQPGQYESQCSKALTIRVEKGDDLAVMPLNYQFEADTYRASGEQIFSQDQTEQEHMRVWGTTAQGVYRAGDTIQYKIYVRGQNNEGLTAAPPSSYRLQLIDPTGKLVADIKKVALSEFGATSGEVTVPKTGAVGWYKFRLLQKLNANAGDPEGSNGEGGDDNGSADAEGAISNGDWFAWRPMQVLVSDFTPASFRVTATVNGKVFSGSQPVEVEGKAELHSGGPYTNATARITAMFDPRPMSSGHPTAAGFDFSRSDLDTPSNEKMIAQLQQPLDAQGLAKTTIAIPDQGTDTYGDLTFEVAVADDRGKNIANAVNATYAATDRFVGLKPTAWIFQAKKPASYQYIVVDDTGVPVKDTAANLKIEFKKVTAARVKSAGNTYQTVYNTSWEAAGTCTGTPEAQPASCDFTPKDAGEYRITATVKGHNGKEAIASSDFWVTGSDVVLWDSEPDTALQMFPEKPSYKVGDTARYLIKNPYPNAKALITIERYGVIDRFVKTFTTSTPIVEFPVKPNYAPGFYVSVVLISPRVDKPVEANMVDLGKPSFRMGYLTVPVTDPYNELAIKAKAEREEYRPGETVKVSVHAAPRHDDKHQPVEFAVAVLDQAVFDLVTGGKAYFDPYKGFYRLDNLDVRNYNLLLKLVGRQKFEKKGANPGGDGGADFKFRDDSKYIAYWNPSLVADANGDARFEFAAPDNLTGWHILVIGATATDKAGLGEGDFKVNRPTEIRPVMPNQVMEGDKFTAGFSVMNRTDKKRHLTVNIAAEGNVDASTPGALRKEIDLDPYQRTTVFLPLTAGRVATDRAATEGAISFKATAGDAVDKDGYLYKLPVGKRIDLVTSAFYGTTDTGDVTTSVAIPKEIRTDAGSLSVILSSTVVTDVAGAFRYIADYPFLCWEQRITKGVMAANFAALKKYLPASLTWDKAADTLKDTLSSAADFQAPNGGMAYWVASNERVDPYLSAYTALSFGWLHARGADVPAPVEDKLQAYLQEFLRKDMAPDYYSADMTASVRAVALAALSQKGHVTLRDIERLRPQFKTMGLFGDAMLLQASLTLKDEPGRKLSHELVDMILAHSNQTSGKLLFSEPENEGFARILATPLRDNCAILSSFVAFGREADQKQYVADTAFKLVRAISQNQRVSGFWGNTQENMFCTTALADYAAAYESVTPDLLLTAALAGEPLGTAELKGVDAAPATLEHQIGANDPGRKASLTVKREGQGRLYYSTRLAYAPTEAAATATNSGIEIRREYSVERDGKWVLLGEPATIKRGELVRVDLFVSLPAARNFVVVNDPVPGGLEPVNRDLATASAVDAAKGAVEWPAESWWHHFASWIDYDGSFWGFYHQELRDDSVRFYSDYLDAGNYHLAYMTQAIATGEFQRRAVKAEEMYDPDVFGLGVAGRLIVEEK